MRRWRSETGLVYRASGAIRPTSSSVRARASSSSLRRAAISGIGTIVAILSPLCVTARELSGRGEPDGVVPAGARSVQMSNPAVGGRLDVLEHDAGDSGDDA